MKVYHFHNGSGGGVLSVIRNLIRFSEDWNIENHIIYVINKAIVPDYHVEPVLGAASQQVYYYSASNNYYYTCRQLASLLPDHKAIIVAHDWIELGMASNLGLQNPVVYILHGDYDYYYELATKHRKVIDAYICISPKIFRKVKNILPSRLHDIFHLYFPVPAVVPKRRLNDSLRLIYFVRDLTDHRKQFSTILEIAGLLSNVEGNYFFTIAGGGMTAARFFKVWPIAMKDRVNYLGFRSSEELMEMLPAQDVFLLPSLLEGLPVSLVEAMKAGVVPLVSKWDGAVEELVKPCITGYHFDIGAAADYVKSIQRLQADRQLLQELSANCIKTANALFDPVSNIKKYERVFNKVASASIIKKYPSKTYGSRLDQRWLGNTLTYMFRSIAKNKGKK